MKMNDEGRNLIRQFEGCRTRAYRDAVGVWTVGYGHTSMAGSPSVAAATRVTRARAEAILDRDLERFCGEVASLIRTPLNDNQFSALVCFAFNVGVGNFRKSSVLAAVNGGDLASVPRRLALWVKAGGRMLPGLVKRRAAEAALFMAAEEGEDAAPVNTRRPVEPIVGKDFKSSSTNIAAVISAAGAAVTSATGRLEEWLGDDRGYAVGLIAVVMIFAAALWIIRERCLKSSLEGI